MSSRKHFERGFTLIEVIIVIAIVTTLFAFVGINLFNAQHKASISATVTTLITDMKNQQTQAMTGNTEGRAAADSYGIYFATNGYTLFHGASFSQNDPTNFTINLDSSLQFSNITFPNSSVIFLQGSGEVSGFVNNSNTVTLKTTQGTDQKTITINSLGVITGVN